MDKLPDAKPPDRLLAIPMRRRSFQSLVCSVLAAAMLIATSQYLTHFHVPRGDIAGLASTSPESAHMDQAGHDAAEHCSLCLQFDRLPAPPASLEVPRALFFLIATLEAERLERLALDLPYLWPPSRGPPLETC